VWVVSSSACPRSPTKKLNVILKWSSPMSTIDLHNPDSATPLVRVTDLSVHFPIRTGLFRRKTAEIRAVDGVSFTIPQGQTVGLVGESGSGKTTVGRTLIRLQPPTTGQVFYAGQEITTLSHSQFFPY